MYLNGHPCRGQATSIRAVSGFMNKDLKHTCMYKGTKITGLHTQRTSCNSSVFSARFLEWTLNLDQAKLWSLESCFLTKILDQHQIQNFLSYSTQSWKKFVVQPLTTAGPALALQTRHRRSKPRWVVGRGSWMQNQPFWLWCRFV